MRHIIPISGKDSLTTALVQMQRAPEYSYELMYNVTGVELPEVDDWLSRVEQYLGLSIHRVGKNLEDIIDEQGMLPNVKARYCTRMAKIYPMEDWIGVEPALVYYGIRADEKRTGYINTKKPNITPIYPLVEEGIGLDGVMERLHAINLMPPSFFWQSLYADVVQLLGSDAVLIERLHPIARQQLFAGRTRPNCFFCFFQRGYEWVWLLETHPDLFWRSVEIEETTGAEDYTWRYKQSLRELAEKAPQMKANRAKKVASAICDMFAPKQAKWFDDGNGDEAGDVPDMLQVVSCGLLCGK